MPCPKSIILKTTDLEQVIEKAENIYNFYLDSNWEFRFIDTNVRIFCDIPHLPAFLNALGVLPVWRLKYWPKAVGSSKP